MIDIRPISDLRNNFTEIEEKISSSDKPIIFTKNGRGSMVLMSLDRYSKVASMEYVENALDEADQYAESHVENLTHEDIFSKIRTKTNG
jgi:prevent-host-death family protein